MCVWIHRNARARVLGRRKRLHLHGVPAYAAQKRKCITWERSNRPCIKDLLVMFDSDTYNTLCIPAQCVALANNCTLPTPLPTGYISDNITCMGRQTADGCLSGIDCAPGFHGSPVVTCASNSGKFTFDGCVGCPFFRQIYCFFFLRFAMIFFRQNVRILAAPHFFISTCSW